MHIMNYSGLNSCLPITPEATPTLRLPPPCPEDCPAVHAVQSMVLSGRMRWNSPTFCSCGCAASWICGTSVGRTGSDGTVRRREDDLE